jgi:hypothetical protein
MLGRLTPGRIPAMIISDKRETRVSSRTIRVTACFLLGCGASVISRPVHASPDNEFTTVSASASEGYVRGKNPDGSFQAESYAFGEGGFRSSGMHDGTIDSLSFRSIAETLAVPLAQENYLPSHDPNETKLLIMVYWGATHTTRNSSDSQAYQQLQENEIPSPDVPQKPVDGTPVPGSKGGIQGTPNNYDLSLLLMASLENKRRDIVDWQNAGILGYDTELPQTGLQLVHNAKTGYRDDIIKEIEYSRYFVVLMAYDFQMTWKQRKQKLLWVTRISIAQLGNDFGKRLPGMALYGSKFFGHDSHGLVRRRLPEGTVEIGAPTSVLYSPAK